MKRDDVFKTKLKQLFETTGLKKLALARHLGFVDAKGKVVQSKLSRILSGEFKIHTEMIDPICTFFGVDRNWFMDGSTETTSAPIGTPTQVQDQAILDRLVSRLGVSRAIDILCSYGGWPIPPPTLG